MATRWGICSAGLIANDFCAALRTLPSSEHEIVAVGARKKEDAVVFAKQFDIPTAHGSYEELAKDANVEIAYVAPRHPYHYSACMLFLEHGKHVLCEKPVTMTQDECQQLVDKARERKLFFMEGIWTRFFPAMKLVRQELESGSLGQINILRATFATRLTSFLPDLGRPPYFEGGSLLTKGCYVLHLAQLVFKQRPEKYKGGAMAVLCYHDNCAMGNNTATIHGTQGNLRIHDDIHTPTTVTLPSGETKHFPIPDTDHKFYYWNSIAFIYEAQAVRTCLQKGLTESPDVPHEDSLSIMAVIGEAHKQMGISFKSA
ncbi:hypothetical protein BaRGS_00038678 [Batillaria attramentaria]|uniref:Trans-1,2-dihydrobenzene-1,2-diol dehydrogenase n=1 Tax=Batillaria attramentaria TaxID=370345 RepID=A0ABD0J631_9CAEN